MGAVVALPYARMADWRNGLSVLRRHGFELLALTPADGATPIGEVKAGEWRALLLGSEGDGLSARWLHEADPRVRIPLDEAALARRVGSPNVGAAAQIACHEVNP